MAAVTLTTETAVNSSFTPMFNNFEDYSTYRLYLCGIATLYISNIVLGLPSNLYIVWLITAGTRSGVTSEFSSLNLAVYEIIVCFTSLPAIFYILTYTVCVNCLIFYIFLFFNTLLCMGRPLFQCCVCVERYVAVVHPVLFLRYKPLRYRVVLSAVIWLILLVFCASNMLTDNWMYYILLPYYLLLLSIKALCSVAVLRALRQPSPGCGARDVKVNRMKKKAFWMMVVFLMSMVINLCPAMFFICVAGVLTVLQKVKGMFFVYTSMVLTGFVHSIMFFYRFGKLPFNCFLKCSPSNRS